MRTETLCFLVAACFASAAVSTGIGGLHAVSALALVTSCTALALFVRRLSLSEGQVAVLIAVSTASAVSALIGWRAPAGDEQVLAAYAAPGAVVVLLLWAGAYLLVHRSPAKTPGQAG